MIDYDEAKQLFADVREPTELEALLEELLLGVVRAPSDRDIVEWLSPELEEGGEEDDDNHDKSQGDAEGASAGTVPGGNGQSTANEEFNKAFAEDYSTIEN